MPLILPGNVASATAATTFSVANSVRFNRADSPTLLKAFGTPTNQDKWTFSIWCKRSGLGTTQNLCACQSSGTKLTSLRFDSDNTLNFYDYTGAYNGRIATNRVFRDVSAWYHIVIVWDSGNATAGNRMRMYVNGIEETSFGTDTNPDQNLDSDMNTSGENLDIGHADDGNYFDGYLAEAVFCDGQTYAASDFGEFNEDSPTIWQPKDVSTLTFGSNGGYYDFEDSANLGNDANGGTDLTEANLAAADQATDTPTNNFCTWNPPANSYYSDTTFSEGNCKMTSTSGEGGISHEVGTFGLTAGKWYWEVKMTTMTTSGGNIRIGITDAIAIADPERLGNQVNDAYSNGQYGNYSANGNIYHNNGNDSYGGAWNQANSGQGKIIGVALDLDNNKIYFAIDNTWQASGDPAADSNGHAITAATSTSGGQYFPTMVDQDDSVQVQEANFGGCPSFTLSSAAADGNGYGAFEYAPPSGYLALCTKNLGSDGG
jgi:hypothetical protein